MALDRRMQYFIEQILPIIWGRYLIPAELTYLSQPTALRCREVSPALIELLSKAIWVQSKIAFHHWVQYLRKYYDRMVSSPKLFVMYVVYACNTMGYNVKDHYERFITVCSLLVGFGANFHYSGKGEVLQYIPKILAVFFERSLVTQFNDRGGWKRLDKYLSRQEYLSWHDETQISCPNETRAQKVARELNFAKKVEMAIKASANPDYNADFIFEKDVEDDLTTIQMSEEIMTYFPQTSAVGPFLIDEKWGSKRLKSDTTNQPTDDGVEAKKKMVKDMMAIVERKRLDLEEKAKQLQKADSDTALSTQQPIESIIPYKLDNIQDSESASNALKTKTEQKPSRNKKNVSLFPSNPQSTKTTIKEKRPNLSMDKRASNTQKRVKKNNEQTTSGMLKDRKSAPNNMKSNEETNDQKTYDGLLEDVKTLSINDKSSKKYNQQNAPEILGAYKTISINLKSNEDEHLLIQSSPDILKDFESVSSSRNATYESMQNTLGVIRTIESSFSSRESTKDINKHVSVKPEDYELASSIPPSTQCKDLKMDKNKKEIVHAIDKELSIEADEQKLQLPADLRDSELVPGKFQSFDTLKTIENLVNDGTFSATSSKAKFQSKREAMNAMIKIIDGLAPKIEMFVVMIDSLVWDLKEES